MNDNANGAASDHTAPLTPENSFTDYPDIVTVPQIMKMLCIGRNTAYRLLNNGELKFVRIGSSYKIPKVCVIDYINKNAQNGNEFSMN